MKLSCFQGTHPRKECDRPVRKYLTLLIAYETAGDRERAILAQLSTHDLLTRITEIDYRLGGSSTETYLTRIAQREQLEIQLNRYRLERETAKRQLLSLTGFSTPQPAGETSNESIAL
ncbi:TolC family protein [Microcystis aeruginosa]|uniref:TolC family protein n=1 Tax=Microcystis aeruginosa TaxID=1126 RepID=UPI0020A252D3|nr:TolC family protein [Microcystis aeruginosa]